MLLSVTSGRFIFAIPSRVICLGPITWSILCLVKLVSWKPFSLYPYSLQYENKYCIQVHGHCPFRKALFQKVASPLLWLFLKSHLIFKGALESKHLPISAGPSCLNFGKPASHGWDGSFFISVIRSKPFLGSVPMRSFHHSSKRRQVPQN